MKTLGKPSAETLTELRRVGHNRTILEYFQLELEDTKDALVATSDTTQIRVLQGKAQTLTDILKLITPL